jgi:hypothetical protein
MICSSYLKYVSLEMSSKLTYLFLLPIVVITATNVGIFFQSFWYIQQIWIIFFLYTKDTLLHIESYIPCFSFLFFPLLSVLEIGYIFLFTPIHMYIVVPCRYIPQFILSVFSWWTLILFQFFGYCNYYPMNYLKNTYCLCMKLSIV